MAQHTYFVESAVNNGDSVTLKGTADGIPFAVQIWNNTTTGMTAAQLKAYVKNAIDQMIFPATTPMSAVLLGAVGQTFTL